jgi:suppressor of ftsI
MPRLPLLPRFATVAVLLALAALAAVPLRSTGAVALRAPRAEPLCAEPRAGTLQPSADLYCLELLPRPDVPSASGTAELGRAATPFDVALTAGGSQRYDVTLALAGLPPVESLGPYTAYVAWVAAPSLDPERKLGVVRNGRTAVGEVEWDKFLVFVTAERSGDVRARQGRLVLRGFSPSIRMQQHGMDLPASATDSGMSPSAASAGHAGHAGHGAMTAVASGAGAPSWFMPPHRPQHRMIAMPGIDELVPAVAPFLPAAGMDVANLPEARPRTMVTLGDGDTLDLTASIVRRTINGRALVMYAYNGQIPGPLLRVREGATVIVRFRNAIDLPSAVHWHGVRLENASDGAVGVTQDEVPAGGSFTYRVHFRDAGIYWYHPHVREDIQQDLGLYGNMLVAPARPDAFAPAHREEVLMLDDLLLGSEGLLPYGRDAVTHALMGRFGNVLLVNGETGYAARVHPGEVVRYFLTNVSNTRTFNVSFGGARMKLVGADIGRYERESWVDAVTLAPAQRYIVDVHFPVAGRHALVNRVQAIDHMVGNFFPEVDTLGVVTVSGPAATPDHRATFERLRLNRDVVDDIARYRPWFDRPPDHQLLLTLRLGELPYALLQMIRKDGAYAHPVELSGTMPMMDWLSTSQQATWVLRDPATGRENMDVRWRFRVGDVVKIRVANDRAAAHPMPHPLHLHGQRFLVLSHNGVPTPNLVWKDTVLLPVGDVVDVLVEMSNPGLWMMHCHIAEHLQSGMMGLFEVR